MDVREAHAIAVKFIVDYKYEYASVVIADLARLLGPEVVCAIAMEQKQAVQDADERLRKMIENRQDDK